MRKITGECRYNGDCEYRCTQTWMPIYTAPKDKRVIVKTDREIYAAHWGVNYITGKEAWIVARLDNVSSAIVWPTHWMPLPDNATMDEKESIGEICPNCDCALPEGCEGVFRDEKECRYGK